ncbi:MAG: ABC transporter substrate-binding protein [Candidatus Bathyarchaeia archaeon]
MSEKKSRRGFLKTAGVGVGGLVVGALAGTAVAPLIAPPPPKAKWADLPPSGSTIIHGMDAAYPPFTQIDPSGNAVGFDVDVVNLIANKYGWQIVHKPWDWSAIITAVQSGDLDFVASGMTDTAARSEIVWFSVPYYSYIHQLLALVTETRSRDDILNSGGFIACQTGATSDEWATKLLAKGYKFQKLGLDSYELAFKAVTDGRAVAVISDSAFTGPLFKTQPDVAAKFRVVSTIGGDATYGYATRPGDYGLRNAISHALEDIMATTDWQDLRDKWSV